MSPRKTSPKLSVIRAIFQILKALVALYACLKYLRPIAVEWPQTARMNIIKQIMKNLSSLRFAIKRMSPFLIQHTPNILD